MKETVSPKPALKFWREWAKPILVILLITGALRSALADWNDVPTGSMKPTILEGDRVFVNKLAYDLKVPFTTWHLAQWGNPKRGDIVVFFAPKEGTRMVKRVVGLPGDVIELRSNVLLINGEPLRYEAAHGGTATGLPEEERTAGLFAQEQLGERTHLIMWMPERHSMRSFAPVRVPDGQYFMMGDSRDNSLDSRFYGFVERRQIVGRASSVVISLDRDNYYHPRWSRFFSALQ